jgi:DNA gyrase subunit A
MRHPTVDGQGTSDRSTAIRPRGDALHRSVRAADDMMSDLDNETVDFTPNHDETSEEPTVLPAPFPNLLVNGSTGIAGWRPTCRRTPARSDRACIWLIEEHPFRPAGLADRAGEPYLTRAEKLRNLIASFPPRTFPPAASLSGDRARCRRT